ncbi:Homeobox domain containing protein [Aphelenchoides avenae]|nr:Homeobox domain containing protein [Aphelenchus avenae]
MTCECKPTTAGGHEDEVFYPLTTIGFQVDQIDCICEALYQSRDGDRLVRMFRRDPSILTFRTNAVLRAYLFTLYSNGNFEQFFLEMSKNKFDPAYHKELVGLWYEAKYADEERRRRKTLGPVDKYRIRKKNPPPRTIWDGQEEKYSFKAPARKVLKSYYESNPYPTAADKREIEMRTGLHATQASPSGGNS